MRIIEAQGEGRPRSIGRRWRARDLRGAFRRLSLLLMLLATACSSGGVRGEAPFAEVTGWSLEGDQIAADLRLRNVNSEPLEVRDLAIAVELEDSRLVDHREQRALSIPANGTETISLRMSADPAGVALLNRLEAGERTSLSYSLRGAVSSLAEGELEFRREGRVYRVPGRSGQFR